MAEALAAIGIVANIAQLVGLGLQLTSTGVEIYNSLHGVKNEHYELELVINDVEKNIQDIKSALNNPHGLGANDKKVILPIAAECEAVSSKLLKILESIKVSDGARFKGLETLKKTSKAFARQRDIKNLEERLLKLNATIRERLSVLLQEYAAKGCSIRF